MVAEKTTGFLHDTINNMKKNEKKVYLAPEAQVEKVAFEKGFALSLNIMATETMQNGGDLVCFD